MDYNRYSDAELMAAYTMEQDIHALYFLVYERYKKDFVDIASGILKSYHLKRNDDDSDVIFEINDFFSFLVCGKIDNSSRLSGYDASRSFKNYILFAFRNYILQKIQTDFKRNSGEDIELYTGTPVEDNGIEQVSFNQIKYLSILETIDKLESLPASKGGISERDLYIWLTFVLYRTTVGDNSSVYFPLAKQLGMEVCTVRQVGKRVKDRISNSAKHLFFQNVTFNT